jgi:quercetin dioxygenase-like cupin family protein
MSETGTIGPWSASNVRWLGGRVLGGTFGAAIELVVPVGEGYPVHSIGENERVVYVYSGEGLHRGTGGRAELESDDVLVLPPDSWHGFTNTGDEPAKLWIAWTPAAGFPAESFDLMEDADVAVGNGEVIKRKLRGAREDPSTTTKEKGFENLGIIWDGAAGARAITLGWAHFETNGTHHMHRHPGADEVLHVASGTGLHTTHDHVVPMVGPAYDFAPAGEWHKMVVPEGRMQGMFFYIGGNSLEAAGYELEEV